jgi:hypothetical protein
MGWEQALEIASRITHPIAAAAFGAVVSAILFIIAFKKKQSRIPWLFAAAVPLLMLAPLLSSTYLQSRGLYAVRVFVLGLDKQPVDDANVTSSGGGEPKKIKGGWEFDIPPQSRPADGRVKLCASEKNAFLAGNSTLVLDKDYFPNLEIQLQQDTSAMLRGVVVGEQRRSVAGAQISIPGYTWPSRTRWEISFCLRTQPTGRLSSCARRRVSSLGLCRFLLASQWR